MAFNDYPSHTMLDDMLRNPVKLLRVMRLKGLLPLHLAQLPSEGKMRFGTLLDYELQFFKALMTFSHQVIYDIKNMKVLSFLIFWKFILNDVLR